MSRGHAATLLLILLAAPVLAGCAAPASTVESSAVAPPHAPGAVAVLHEPGAEARARLVAEVEPLFASVGHDAAEPTLGITRDGHLFYAAATFVNDVAGVPLPILPRTDILRSSDGAASWVDVTPYLPGGVVRSHPETGDPMVYVDPATDRIFDIDQRLLTTCYTLVTSDDLGESWTLPSPACMTPGMADHQTIVASKPRTLTTVGYPNVVHVCYNIVATSACVRSLDGGATFAPAGPVGSLGVDPALVDPAKVARVNDPDARWLCSGLVGRLRAAPDGTVLLPRRECAQALLFVSKDDGSSWTRVKVADDALHPVAGALGMDPSVAVDEAGNVYYLYQAADGRLKLSHSADMGATWSAPFDVLRPGLTVGNLGTIAATGDGSVAIAYYGSSVEGGAFAAPDAMEKATWDGYLAFVTDATRAALVTTTRVNPADDPVFRGACAIGRCGSVRDFIDVAIDGDGRPWATFVDACVDECATSAGKARDSTAFHGMIATLVRGPSLRDPAVALPPIRGALP